MEEIADSTRAALIKGGLRTVASVLPGGGAFVQAWTEFEDHQRNKRIEEFFHALATLVKDCRDEIALKDCGLREEMPALIAKTVDKIEKEASAAKRLRFATLLVNAACADEQLTYDDKVSLLDTLDFLTETDLRHLLHFSSANHVKVATLMGWPENCQNGSVINPPAIDVALLGRVVASLRKLESRGLITELRTSDEIVYEPNVESYWLYHWSKKSFEVLPFGKLLLQTLETPASQSESIRVGSPARVDL